MIVSQWCMNCRRSWGVSRSSCLTWNKSVRSLRRGKAKRQSSKTRFLRLTGVVLQFMLLREQTCFKTTGVQADLASHFDLTKKLLDIWRTSSYQYPRRNQMLFCVSRVLLVCGGLMFLLLSLFLLQVEDSKLLYCVSCE